jgi:hypothetical protein
LSALLKKRKHTEWTPEIIATLGVLTDAQVVAKFDLAVSPSAVTERRHIPERYRTNDKSNKYERCEVKLRPFKPLQTN